MAHKSKMQAAQRTLDGRLDRHEREVRRGAAEKQHADCVVRGDAISFGCKSVDMKALRAHPNFRCFSDGWIKREKPDAFLPYRRIARIQTTNTKSKFWVYSEPQMPHLPPFRIAYFPEDVLGLRSAEISSVLELTAGPRIVRMEVAYDFGPRSGVTAAYVRRHFISGKCQPHSVREKAGIDQWGTRASGKFIRSYFKREIGAHRVELQLNGRFLRKHGIDDVFQFHKLVALLPVRHFLFARLDEQLLIQRLRTMHLRGHRILEILKEVAAHEGNLGMALNFLRREVGVTNVRRLLVRLQTTRLAHEALRNWAAMWPKVPARLGKRR